MHSELPLISVVIPVYNGERYLGEAIRSTVDQSWPATEIIVVDDGSTDRTAAVAREFAEIRYVFTAQGGAGAARNRGVAIARGDYLAFLDADDLWTSEKLEWQMTRFDAPDRPDLVLGHVDHFLSPDLDEALANRIYCPSGAMPGTVPGTLLIRIETFKRVGSFNETLRVGEFVDWYSRAMEMSLTAAMLPQVVLRRRLHAANSGILRREARSDYLRVIKASLERRRRAKEAVS